MKLPSTTFYRFFLFLSALFFTETPTFALNAQNFRPHIAPTGSFRLSGTETLAPGQVTLGFHLNYSRGSLAIQDTTSGTTTQKIVSHLFSQDLQAEVGLHRLVTVGLDIPLHLIQHTPVSGGLDENSAYRIGDLQLYGRFRILDQEKYFLGLALIPFLEFPTGSVAHLTGDESVDFGLIAALEKKYKRLSADVHMGYRGHGKDESIAPGSGVLPLIVDDEFLYGLGLGFEILPNRLTLIGDLVGSTQIEDFASRKETSPLELSAGFRSWLLDRKLTLNLGAGTGLISGFGSPSFRVFSGITWNFKAR